MEGGCSEDPSQCHPCSDSGPRLPWSARASGPCPILVLPVTESLAPESLDTCPQFLFLPEATAPLCLWPRTSTPGQGPGLGKERWPPGSVGAPCQRCLSPHSGASSVPTLTLPPVPQPLGLWQIQALCSPSVCICCFL